MATTWQLEGRLLPHERLWIHWRGRPRGALVLLLMVFVPWFVGDRGGLYGSATGCGTPRGTEPHTAWFRCTAQLVESQYMSDFPVLHELSNVATRYHLAVENDDLGTRTILERQLLLMVKDESWKK